MPVDRPTFSESWYRVADLRPRLRSTVQVRRQHFRGQMWHILQDPSSNDFFRLTDSGYGFVGLLDGRRTVAEAWRIAGEQWGDSAPTQGEAIQLLGQLYTFNLLQAELPPDAVGLFRRYRKRVAREVKGYLSNLLFVRMPLLDPDRFLDRWVGVFGKLFTLPALVVWFALMAAGLYFAVGHARELADRASGVLDPSNLPLLYLSFVFIKVFHEFAHGFACKKFGQIEGTEGEVHVMGVMFLVFTPIPYVDASSAWAFRRKRHRVVVGAAGILIELAIAAVAAIVWANTAPGAVRSICYNVMFIASVSTLLFNGNPLLRYDGYYILSDLLETPNLAQRSKQYIYYLVRRYVYGVRRPLSPANTPGEKGWFVFYGVASTVYRVWICVRILLFVTDKLFFVGAVLAVLAVVAWVLTPLGKFLHYLLTGPELLRVRARAVGITLLVLLAAVAAVGMVPVADRGRIEGVVEPVDLAMVYARSDGFVREFHSSGGLVRPDRDVLIRAENRELEAELEQMRAERKVYVAQRRLAIVHERSAIEPATEKIDALDQQIARAERRRDELALRPRIEGQWIAPEIDRARGAYVRRGDTIGMVASLDRVRIRAIAHQEVPLAEIDRRRVEIRVKGRPDHHCTGKVISILPFGQQRLPSAALGYAAGGSIQTVPDDRRGTKTAEGVFDVLIAPDPNRAIRLLSGQLVVVRFSTPPKPLALQWLRSIRRLVLRRFHLT